MEETLEIKSKQYLKLGSFSYGEKKLKKKEVKNFELT